MNGGVGRCRPSGCRRRSCTAAGNDRPSERNHSQTRRAEPSSAKRSKTQRIALPDGLVGMKQYLAVVLTPNEAGGQSAAQFASSRLVANAAFEARADDVQLGLAHGALEPEQQSVIEPGRMIDAVGIADQRVGHGHTSRAGGTSRRCCAPGARLRGRARCPTSRIATAAMSRAKPERLSSAGTGQAEVLVDDDDLFSRPAQVQRRARPTHTGVRSTRDCARLVTALDWRM